MVGTNALLSRDETETNGDIGEGEEDGKAGFRKIYGRVDEEHPEAAVSKVRNDISPR